MKIKHRALEMQKYLKPNQISTIEESQEIFRIRNKVTDVKENFKGKRTFRRPRPNGRTL